MQSTPAAQAGADLGRAGAHIDSVNDIEAWIKRAEGLPDGKAPEPPGSAERPENRLRELAARHFPGLAEPHPHIHLIGVTGLEKRLLAWVSRETGLPNPFDFLDMLTGDPDALRRATDRWEDAHAEIVAAIDGLCVATEHLHGRWHDPRAGRFFEILADYLSELDALESDVKTTLEALRGLQAEAALAEATIVGLVNLLVGSFGGYLVETVLTAGAMTPAVAAQAQLELTWVLKQVARVLRKLPAIYANTRHVLQSVSGFKGLEAARSRFQIAEIEKIESTVNHGLA